MQLTTALTTLVLSLVASTGALTIGERTADGAFEVLHTRDVLDGTLTWYGDSGVEPAKRAPEEPEAAASLAERQNTGCGSYRIECGDKYSYYGPTCQKLIVAVTSDSWLFQSPRAVCFGQDGADQCCISWSKVPLLSTHQRDLVASANRVLAQCGLYSVKSGLERNVLLGGTCMTQCLSNRPTGCQ